LTCDRTGLFPGRPDRLPFLQQTLDQIAQGALVLQRWIPTSTSTGRSDHTAAVDHHNLGDVENFVSGSAKVGVYILFGRVTDRIGELKMVHQVGDELRPGGRTIRWIEGDANGLEAARTQIGLESVQRLSDTETMLRRNEKKTPAPPPYL